MILKFEDFLNEGFDFFHKKYEKYNSRVVYLENEKNDDGTFKLFQIVQFDYDTNTILEVEDIQTGKRHKVQPDKEKMFKTTRFYIDTHWGGIGDPRHISHIRTDSNSKMSKEDLKILGNFELHQEVLKRKVKYGDW